MAPSCSHQKAWLRLGDQLSRWLIHMAGKFGVSCCQEISVLCHKQFHLGLLACPHDRTTDFLQRKWSKRQQSRSCDIFSSLFLEVTHHLFSSILLVTQVNPIQCERAHDHKEVRITRSKKWLVPQEINRYFLKNFISK